MAYGGQIASGLNCIDHEMIDDHIVCPYCGFKYDFCSSYECYSENESSLNCDECGKEFNYVCENKGVMFSTFKK